MLTTTTAETQMVLEVYGAIPQTRVQDGSYVIQFTLPQLLSSIALIGVNSQAIDTVSGDIRANGR